MEFRRDVWQSLLLTEDVSTLFDVPTVITRTAYGLWLAG